MPTTTLRLAAGADIGGTSTRIALRRLDTAADDRAPLSASPMTSSVTESEDVLVTVGPGANLRSSGTAALSQVATTLGKALEGARAHWGCEVEIAAFMAGMSGAGAARHGEVLAALQESCAPLGVDPDAIEVGPDLLTAFLTGGVGDSGVLLLAGTGAVAVRFDGKEIAERLDGMGWLLGDIGSAVWLGRRTLEAVAADLDGRGRRTALTEELGEELGVDLRPANASDSPTGDPRQDLIRALDDAVPTARPAAMGRFGPLPARCSEDPVARGILDGAVRHLVDSVRRLDPDASLPVVLAGSVLTADGLIHDEVAHGLDADGRTVAIAPDGLAGALRLAEESAR